MADAKLPHATDWFVLVFILGIVLVALFRAIYPKRFRAFIKLPTNKSYFSELSHEKEHPLWYVVFTEGILVLGITQLVYLYVSIQQGGITAAGYVTFLRVLLIALLILTLQRFLHSLTGLLFDMKKTFGTFIEIKDGHLQWAALMLIFICALAVFGPFGIQAILYIGLILLGSLYAVGVTRAALLVDNKTLSGLQLFLYLCALEILPVLTLVKWLA